MDDSRTYPFKMMPDTCEETITSFDFVIFTPLMEIEGAIRWDGCCNMRTSDGVAWHFCNIDQFNTISNTFRKIYQQAAASMGGFG